MAERVAFIDFDLTLFKTYDFAEAVEAYYADQGLDLSKLVYEQGTAPDLLALIEQVAGHPIDVDVVALEAYIRQHFGKTPRDFIQPDALDLLESVRSDDDTDATILTRGGEKSQRLKLSYAARAIGEYDSTIIKVGDGPKGEYIAKRYDGDGYHYERNGQEAVAPNAVLIEDKMGDIIGLPAHDSAQGIWIQRRAVTARDRQLHRDMNRAGHHVLAVSSLFHTIQLLKAA